MPLFEYECRACGHVTTFLEKAGTKETHACEACGATDMAKKLSTFAARANGDTSACDTGGCPTGTCCSSGMCNL